MAKVFSAFLYLFVSFHLGCCQLERLSSIAESCVTVNGGRGECVQLKTCQPVVQLVRSMPNSPITTWMLRQSHCGFDGNEPKICCPIENDNDEKSNQIEQATTKQNWITTALPSSTLPPSTTLPTTTSTSPPTTILPITTSTLPPTTTLPTTTSTLPPTTTLPTTTSTLPTTTSTLPAIISTLASSTTLPTPSVPVNRTRRPQVKANPTPDYKLLALFGDTCNTVYNTTGTCIDIYMCEPFVALAKQARSNPIVADVLKNASCGFKRNIPQVCCPLPYQSTDLPTTTQIPTAQAPNISVNPRINGDFLNKLPEPPMCGLTNISLDRVVGGIPAKLGAFPWMALLGYRDLSIAAGMRWSCGGALVTTRHVLTAAHCIHNLEDDLYLVRLGELDLSREDEGATPVDIPIKTMYKHEKYTRNNPVINDVGVLVLDKDVVFTELIKPICLFTASSNMWKSETFEGYNPFVAGWGDVKWNGIRASHLQVAQLPVMEDDVCQQSYNAYINARTRQQFSQQAMCAGYPGGKIDSCKGDSGGPLMQPLEVEGLTPRSYMFAVGVVSFGRRCAEPGFPGVYARVPHYMPWIEEKILGRAS